MEAKDKAKELVQCYLYKVIEFAYAETDYKELAKQCALIAVDEILNNFGLQTTGQTFYTEYRAVEYWKEVKQEIEKL